MNPTSLERENLEAHVDLCAERYNSLDQRLMKLEIDVAEIKKDILDGQKSLKATLITSSTTIIVALLGLIVTIFTKF